MPSARPRLVQEGTPLVQVADDHHAVVSSSGLPMISRYEENNSSHRRHRNSLGTAGASATAPTSSLAMAAAGLVPSSSSSSLTCTKRPSLSSSSSSFTGPRAHRYVVGGEKADENAVMDARGGTDYRLSTTAATATSTTADPSTLPFDLAASLTLSPLTVMQSRPDPHRYTGAPAAPLVTHHHVLPPHPNAFVNNHSTPLTNVPWNPSNLPYQHHQQPPQPKATASPAPARRHFYHIAGDQEQPATEDPSPTTTERMYGIEDHSIKTPLIVVDGANVAFAYAEAMAKCGIEGGGGGGGPIRTKEQLQLEPDVHGIQVAVSYFQMAGCRVLVVLPTWWLRLKPRLGDTSDANAKMLTPQLEILQDLKSRGLLVEAPPKDDDDAYALTIARRENVRARQAPMQYQQGASGFVLSNDMFRDAVSRDPSGQLASWLNHGSGAGASGVHAIAPGRISYAFCDMGSVDEYGDPELDIVPNPKHAIVMQIEATFQQMRINNR